MVRTEHFHVATYETTRLNSGWRKTRSASAIREDLESRIQNREDTDTDHDDARIGLG